MTPDTEGNPNINVYDEGPAMYYSDLQTNITSQREFAIKIHNVNQSTTINLGFMIVEGSETLMDGSTLLTNGIDYTIDYFSGSINFLLSIFSRVNR